MSIKEIVDKDQALLTVGEAAHILSVHKNTVRIWCKKGFLPHYRVGPRRDHRFRFDDIEGMMIFKE